MKTTVSEKETRAYGAGMPSQRDLEELAFQARLRLLRQRKAKHDARHRKDVGHDDR
jgi:hypothetical protein